MNECYRRVPYHEAEKQVSQIDVKREQGVCMAKIQAGIEIPIIPEDFVVTEEELSPDKREFFLQRVDRYIQDGMDHVDLIITETFFNQHPKR